jgi:hypothetical protein
VSEQKYRQRGYRETERGSGGGGFSSDRPARLEGAPRGRGAERNRDEVFRCKVCSEKNDPAVGLDSLCRKCHAPLHACNQCRHFDGAARFQCLKDIPAPLAAKSRRNECALYEPTVTMDLTGSKAADTPDQARNAFDKLFGKR